MKLVLTDSGVRLLPGQVDVAPGEKVGIDWLNLTIPDQAADGEAVTDWHCIQWAHKQLLQWLQVEGVDYALEDLGRRHLGWAKSGRVGEVGLIAAGGNGNTIFVSLSGHGCLLAGVEGLCAIADFCDVHEGVKITRIDLAFDDVEGTLFPVREVEHDWHAGLYTSPSALSSPKLEKRGDWLRQDPNKRGLTVYVGSRQGGQLVRIYEKGKQLGVVDSTWVRVEAELHSSAFLLLPEMLRHPTKFFVALRPAFERVCQASSENQLQRLARLGLADADKAVEVVRKQYGAVIHALRTSWFDSDEELLQAICREGRISPALKRALQVREVALKKAAG